MATGKRMLFSVIALTAFIVQAHAHERMTDVVYNEHPLEMLEWCKNAEAMRNPEPGCFRNLPPEARDPTKIGHIAHGVPYDSHFILNGSTFSLHLVGRQRRPKKLELMKFAVLRNGREVYRFKTEQMAAVSDEIKAFFAQDSSWVLETAYEVIKDGKNLGTQLGHEKIFNYHLMAGRPAYFAIDKGKITLIIDGKPIGSQFDGVVHYACCGPYMCNPKYFPDGITFYGRREEQWYFGKVQVQGNREP